MRADMVVGPFSLEGSGPHPLFRNSMRDDEGRYSTNVARGREGVGGVKCVGLSGCGRLAVGGVLLSYGWLWAGCVTSSEGGTGESIWVDAWGSWAGDC